MLATSRAEDQPSRNEADPRAGSTARRRAMSKSATKEGTTRYAQKFAARAAKGHFRERQRLLLSSLGIGTYLGEPDGKTDECYRAAAVAAGSHCMTPKFLKNQLGRSLKNIGVECVDIYYLHNPETQLSEVSKEEFLNRVREAFTFLESAVEAGEIQYYGMATWNGFRQDAHTRDAMQLGEMAQMAQEIAGGRHHFRFVQLPFNLGMTEALTLGNQSVRGHH